MLLFFNFSFFINFCHKKFEKRAQKNFMYSSVIFPHVNIVSQAAQKWTQTNSRGIWLLPTAQPHCSPSTPLIPPFSPDPVALSSSQLLHRLFPQLEYSPNTLYFTWLKPTQLSLIRHHIFRRLSSPSSNSSWDQSLCPLSFCVFLHYLHCPMTGCGPLWAEALSKKNPAKM